MSSDYVSDLSTPSSPQSIKSQKISSDASPSSSPGSTSSIKKPINKSPSISSRDVVSKIQQGRKGLALFQVEPRLSINELKQKIKQAEESLKQAEESLKQAEESRKQAEEEKQRLSEMLEQSIQQPNSLADTLHCESQDDKYSESQDSHAYDGPDFFKLNNDLDEEINQEEYSQDLDNKIKQITNETEKIDNISVEELETYSQEKLIKIFGEELKKEEFVKLHKIYEILQKKDKEAAKNDKKLLKASEDDYDRVCSQSDNENTQMTTESCMSTATLMEDTIKEIHKNNVIRKIEHKNRQDTVKTILDVRYNKEINFDNIRTAVEEGKSTNEQMSRIWGNYIEGETFKDGHCCYLCGGELVNKDKEFVGLTFNKSLKPEIEHKLPAIEFYGKVHNIINREEYKILFGKWEYFINNPDSNELLLQVYNSINCNETEENNINDALNSLCDTFKEENNEEEHIAKFICLIKINLIEFAYSHHTCNQVKSNNNLRKSANQYTESINNYLSEVQTVIDNNNVSNDGSKQIVGLIKSYKLQHEKNNILGSIENTKNAKRIEGNMRLINSLIDDYTKLCGKTPTRMIAESIRDMKKKITNKKNEKQIKKDKNKIQDQLGLKKSQIDTIISEFESYINYIHPTTARQSPRSAQKYKELYKTLYIEKKIENKNKLIKQMNDIETGTYKDFDKYVKYYNDNIESKFPGVIGGPKSATGGKKSRRLRLKSNRKTKKRCKKM